MCVCVCVCVRVCMYVCTHTKMNELWEVWRVAVHGLGLSAKYLVHLWVLNVKEVGFKGLWFKI